MVTQTQQTTVKSGYNQTEVGVIPEDWKVKRIQKFTNATSGGTPSTFIPEYWGGNIRWMNSGEVNLKKVYDVEGMITELGLKNSSTKLIPPKCILIGLAGQGKTRGTVAINYVELCVNQSIGSIFPNKSFVAEYLYYNLDARYNELRNLSTGEGGRGGLNLTIIRNILIPLPPTIEEQSAIAQVLSDTDNLIEKLEKIITKKKNIKQGTMQELLTGKRKLPRFKDKWEYKTFDELFKFLTTGTNPRSDLTSHGDVHYIHYGDIHTKWDSILDCDSEEIPWILESKVKGLPLLKDGDLVIADASEDYEGVGASILVKNIKNKKIVSGLHTILLRSYNDNISKDYKSFLTSIKDVKNQMISLVTGISVYGLSKTNLKKVKIFLPSDVKEQDAISQALTNMDKEIWELKKKRDKYLMIKKGMMQKLLTGSIRLQ